jgi:hypothetical protein
VGEAAEALNYSDGREQFVEPSSSYPFGQLNPFEERM